MAQATTWHNSHTCRLLFLIAVHGRATTCVDASLESWHNCTKHNHDALSGPTIKPRTILEDKQPVLHTENLVVDPILGHISRNRLHDILVDPITPGNLEASTLHLHDHMQPAASLETAQMRIPVDGRA